MDTAEVRYLKINYDDVLGKLREYAKSKAKAFASVKSIVLTGSLAKGNYTGMSDADVLVIVEGLTMTMSERYSAFADTSLPVNLEPRVYSVDEFMHMLSQADRFAVEAVKVGIPLYGESYFNELKREVKREVKQ